MLIAHRIALDPNDAQATYLSRAAGTARFAYNWALAEWKRQYDACKLDHSLPRPSQAALRRQLNAIKRERFPGHEERASTLGVEDLNVRGMVKNRRLARSVADMGFFELRRQLQYKVAMRGGQVVVADRFFASSKTCSACGHPLDQLPLSVRAWTCPDCGMAHDRDVNAAVNLKNMAVSSTVAACGEEGSGLRRKTKTNRPWALQEVSSTSAQQ